MQLLSAQEAAALVFLYSFLRHIGEWIHIYISTAVNTTTAARSPAPSTLCFFANAAAAKPISAA